MGTGACIRCVTNPSSIVQGVGSQLVGKPQIHGFTQGGFFFFPIPNVVCVIPVFLLCPSSSVCAYNTVSCCVAGLEERRTWQRFVSVFSGRIILGMVGED